MSVWLRYLAIAALIGNGFNAFWGLVALGQMLLLGSFEAGIGRLALNLALSLAGIVLAALIAAPPRQGVSLGARIMAIPGALGGGLGVLSSAMLLQARAGQPRAGLSSDLLAVDVLLTERAVQNAFFSACTLALALLVLASRRSCT